MKKASGYPSARNRKQKVRTGSSAGKFLIATVKGDVHDIGKNIVAWCWHVTVSGDRLMGVMTPTEKIIETAIREKVDIIGLSGLITPSLEEMTVVAICMEKAGLKIRFADWWLHYENSCGCKNCSELQRAGGVRKMLPINTFYIVCAIDTARRLIIIL